jgi:hypothetical protein
LKWNFKGHSFGLKTEEADDENGLTSKAGSSMVFAIGLRKWAVLRVGLLSPAGESMKSSLTSMIVSSKSNGGSFIMKFSLKKLKSLL